MSSNKNVGGSPEDIGGSPDRAKVLREGIDAARKALESGQLPDATRLCEALVQLAPGEPRVWGLKARVLRATGDIDSADEAEFQGIDLMAKALLVSKVPLPLRERVRQFSEVTFLGGPPARFVELGQMQLMVMLEHGLERHHKVLDVGCGALRAGLWLMKVLDEGCYHGIEPHKPRLRFGIDHVVGSDLIQAKKPRFDHNASFDFSVFGARFDFVVARSVWTHASKNQILLMLDGFAKNSAPGAVFLTSFLPARGGRHDYMGEGWVGRSEESSVGGLICHDPAWVQKACNERGLRVRALAEHIENQQLWLKVEAATGARRLR